ncbi:MAG: aminotransferase class I/II-fold pyridoxal phosphate-dependent enzyme [Polyangiaceae bacterium]|nr:aminotransferase class I/II-fold pyridoxal phosphate-dependent enzyme [Polyangiaceae bacterium]
MLGAWLDRRLDALRREGLLREPRSDGTDGAGAAADLSTNDYLGLARRPVSRETPRGGAGASRLLGGDRREHAALEGASAAWVGLPAALAFSSGFAANVGLLGALAGPDVLVVSDAANHASLIDGCRLGRSRVRVVPHLDAAAVAEALREPAALKLVAVESYYSMDADTPDLGRIREACDRVGAALIVDEAHALGVYGPRGAGVLRERGVDADVVVGTYSKAVGAQGAFVAGQATLRAYLWNRARTFVFSTGLSPALAAHAAANVRLAQAAEGPRSLLVAGAARVRAALTEAGLDVRGYGPIIPVVLGESARTLAAAARLRERGIVVSAVRPPTVPPGSSRLRLGLHAGLTDQNLDNTIAEVIAACRAS